MAGSANGSPSLYFPKIMNSNNNRSYPARPNNSRLYDVNRGSNAIQVAEVKRWVDRIHEAIDKGFVNSVSFF